MKTYLFTVLAAGLLAGTGDAPADAKKEKDKLQGTWKAITFEKRGESKEETEEHRLIFAGDEFTLKKGEEVFAKGKFKIDPSKNPKEIDMEVTECKKEAAVGKTVLGIYAVDSEQLKWCFTEPGEAERPKELSTQAGNSHQLVTLKREKSN